MKISLSITLATLIALLTANYALAKELYVDFASGNDDNSGLSAEQAWKHAPGDPNAGSEAEDYDLDPGDTVLFKGGVTYYGRVLIPADGASGKPITYKGNGWGDGPAIISGAQELTGTATKCRSQDACYGNPNWKKLYRYSLKQTLDPLAPIYLGEKRYWLARSPNQSDPFWFDDIKQYAVLKRGDSSVEMTSRSLRLDPDEVSGTIEDWKTALVAVWMRPNVVLIRDVEEYDSASGTIYFQPVKNKPYTKRDSYYALFNRANDIDQPGEYVVDNNAQTLLIWPYDGDQIDNNGFHVNALDNAFNLEGKSNITIDGFRITNFYGGQGAVKSGAGVINYKRTSENIIVQNNTIENLRSVTGVGAIQLHYLKNGIVRNNVVSNDQKNSGIRVAHSVGVRIQDNVIDRIGRTGIRIIGNEDIQVTGNKLSNIYGGHGNGMSVYLKNKNILVANNTISNTPSAFTFHGGKPGEASNFWIFNNIILGRMNSWGSSFPGVVILHNLIFNPDDPRKSLQISGKEKRLMIQNNIIGGFLVKPLPLDWDMSSNIYAALSFTQSRKYNWRLEPDSAVERGLGGNFEDGLENIPAFNRLKGNAIYDELPASIFKDFDFNPWKNPQPIGPSLIPTED